MRKLFSYLSAKKKMQLLKKILFGFVIWSAIHTLVGLNLKHINKDSNQDEIIFWTSLISFPLTFFIMKVYYRKKEPAVVAKSKNIPGQKTLEEVLKRTEYLTYVYADKEVRVYVDDMYEYESQIKKIKNSEPRFNNNTGGVSYERGLELQKRHIDSIYIYPKKDIEDDSNFFFDKKVVITGLYDEFPDRNDLAKLFWEAGADIDRTVGKNTDYLIVGKDFGPSKMKQSIEKGIEIIDQRRLSEFFDF